jgi:hypothetical protein
MYTRNLRSNIPSTICSVERDSKKSWYLPQNERILRAHYKVVYRLHMSLNIYLYKLRLKRFWPIFIEQEWFYAVKVYYLPLFNNLIGLVPMRNRPIKGLITTSYAYDRYKKEHYTVYNYTHSVLLYRQHCNGDKLFTIGRVLFYIMQLCLTKVYSVFFSKTGQV